MSTESESADEWRVPGEVTVVFNAHARLGDAREMSPAVLQQELFSRGLAARVVTPDGEDACVDLTEQACQRGAHAVVAVGGDGTVRAVIRGMLRCDHRPPLGIVPAGTMNNIAATFALPEDFDAALDVLAECLRAESTIPFDIGLLDGAPFVEVAGAGLLAELLTLGEQAKETPQSAGRDLLAALREVVRARPAPVTLVLDGVRRRTRALQVTVCNTPTFGARVALSPNARVDDGLLDVLAEERTSGARMLLDLLPRIGGRRVATRTLSRFQARTVRIEPAVRWRAQADATDAGDCGPGTTRRALTLSVLPAAIRVCARERRRAGADVQAEPPLRTLERLVPAATADIPHVAAEAVAEAESTLRTEVARAVEPPRLAAARLSRLRWLYPLAGAIALGAGLAVRRWELLPGDLRLTLAIQRLRSPFLDRVLSAVAAPGFPPLSVELIGVGVVGLWLAHLRVEATFLLAASGASIADGALKELVRRRRPVDGLVRVVRNIRQPSFPSGHVMSYVSVFGFLAAATLVRLRPSLLRAGLLTADAAMIALVGLARVYLGAHWPSDVAAGYLFGGIYLGGVLELYALALRRQAEASANGTTERARGVCRSRAS